jgi:uncharacterized membrane protein (UPF0127 family)
VRVLDVDRSHRIPVALARTFWSRLRGWMGLPASHAGAGLWLQPCSSVHTFGMRFPIDIVYVGADGTVLAVREQVSPWRLTAPVRGARAVLEVPGGTAGRQGLLAGRRVELVATEA